jgi:acyl carrier protein
MDRASVASKFKQIVADYFQVDVKSLSDSSTFIEDLGAASLDNIEIVMETEAQFKIQTSEDEAGVIRTVGQAIDLILKKL